MKLSFAAAATVLASTASAAAPPDVGKPYHIGALVNNEWRTLHANDGEFWVNKPTKAPCPSSVTAAGGNCALYTKTETTFRTAYGYTSLNTADPTYSPSGQSVYIGPAGKLRFVEDKNSPPSGSTSQYVRKILFSDRVWLCGAKGQKKGAEKFFVTLAKNNKDAPAQASASNTVCKKTTLKAINAPKAKAAWVYA